MFKTSMTILSTLMLVLPGCTGKKETEAPALPTAPPKASIGSNTLVGKWTSANITCADGKTIKSDGKIEFKITLDQIGLKIKSRKKPISQVYKPWMLQGDLLTIQSGKSLSTFEIAKPAEDTLIAKLELTKIEGLCSGGESVVEFARVQAADESKKTVK